MITFTCAGCSKTLRVEGTLSGKKARCPACREKTLIPAPPEAATLPPSVPAQAETMPPAPADPGATLPPVPAPAAKGDGRAPPGYEILGELGRGGMGVVYKARQVALGRVVALKMILSGTHAGEDEMARFRTEGEAIARLQHPGIVQVFDVGEHDGKPYFSLEFCAGGSLEKKLGGVPMQPREAAEVVRALAEAMHAAHQANVIHRDLKPANVLSGADGATKVTDFGLAKKLDDQGQTVSGAIMGTPSYMAPEQAEGKKVGPLADVYALGAILYECLTGRPPFRAATPFDTIMQVVTEEAVPPRQLNAKTPRDLETVALKCLQKDPVKRYASARHLADDLQRYLVGESISARPVGRAERLGRWVRRNPVVAGLTAAVVLLLAVGLATTTALYLKASRSASDLASALEDTQRAEREALKARDDARDAQKTAEAEQRKARQEEQRANAALEEVEATLVAGLLAPLGQKEGLPEPLEFRSLDGLAGLRTLGARKRFVTLALATPESARRVARRTEAVGRALAGLDRALAKTLCDEATTKIDDKDADVSRTAVLLAVALGADGPDFAEKAARALTRRAPGNLEQQNALPADLRFVLDHLDGPAGGRFLEAASRSPQPVEQLYPHLRNAAVLTGRAEHALSAYRIGVRLLAEGKLDSSRMYDLPSYCGPEAAGIGAPRFVERLAGKAEVRDGDPLASEVAVADAGRLPGLAKLVGDAFDRAEVPANRRSLAAALVAAIERLPDDEKRPHADRASRYVADALAKPSDQATALSLPPMIARLTPHLDGPAADRVLLALTGVAETKGDPSELSGILVQTNALAARASPETKGRAEARLKAHAGKTFSTPEAFLKVLEPSHKLIADLLPREELTKQAIERGLEAYARSPAPTGREGRVIAFALLSLPEGEARPHLDRFAETAAKSMMAAKTQQEFDDCCARAGMLVPKMGPNAARRIAEAALAGRVRFYPHVAHSGNDLFTTAGKVTAALWPLLDEAGADALLAPMAERAKASDDLALLGLLLRGMRVVVRRASDKALVANGPDLVEGLSRVHVRLDTGFGSFREHVPVGEVPPLARVLRALPAEQADRLAAKQLDAELEAMAKEQRTSGGNESSRSYYRSLGEGASPATAARVVRRAISQRPTPLKPSRSASDLAMLVLEVAPRAPAADLEAMRAELRPEKTPRADPLALQLASYLLAAMPLTRLFDLIDAHPADHQMRTQVEAAMFGAGQRLTPEAKAARAAERVEAWRKQIEKGDGPHSHSPSGVQAFWMLSPGDQPRHALAMHAALVPLTKASDADLNFLAVTLRFLPDDRRPKAAEALTAVAQERAAKVPPAQRLGFDLTRALARPHLPRDRIEAAAEEALREAVASIASATTPGQVSTGVALVAETAKALPPDKAKPHVAAALRATATFATKYAEDDKAAHDVVRSWIVRLGPAGEPADDVVGPLLGRLADRAGREKEIAASLWLAAGEAAAAWATPEAARPHCRAMVAHALALLAADRLGGIVIRTGPTLANLLRRLEPAEAAAGAEKLGESAMPTLSKPSHLTGQLWLRLAPAWERLPAEKSDAFRKRTCAAWRDEVSRSADWTLAVEALSSFPYLLAGLPSAEASREARLFSETLLACWRRRPGMNNWWEFIAATDKLAVVAVGEDADTMARADLSFLMRTVPWYESRNPHHDRVRARLSRLSVPALLALLRSPLCVEAWRPTLLRELGDRTRRTFVSVWQAEAWARENEVAFDAGPGR